VTRGGGGMTGGRGERQERGGEQGGRAGIIQCSNQPGNLRERETEKDVRDP
jgi:hypothetical protein